MDALAVGTISTALKQAREHQGSSLQDISQAVNVPVRYLQALEGEGDRRLLADTMYLIPFLRTYATYLGFDPNGAVRQFIFELQTSEVTKVKSRLESPLSPAHFSAWILPLVVVLGGLLTVAFVLRFGELRTWWPFGQQEEVSSAVFSSDELVTLVAEEDDLQDTGENVSTEEREPDGQAEDERQEEARTTLVPDAAQGEESEPAQPGAIVEGEAPPPALPSALPATPSSALTLQTSQIPQVPSGLHQLRIHAVEETWLRVVIDGEQTKDVMLSPNQQVQWEARSNFTLTVGNAGGIEVALDGNPVPPLGQSGEVVRGVRLPSVE